MANKRLSSKEIMVEFTQEKIEEHGDKILNESVELVKNWFEDKDIHIDGTIKQIDRLAKKLDIATVNLNDENLQKNILTWVEDFIIDELFDILIDKNTPLGKSGPHMLKEFIKSEIENIWYVIITGYNTALIDGSIKYTTDKYIDIIIDSIITILKQIVKKIKNMNMITLEQMKSICDELDKDEIIIEDKLENSAKHFSFLIYLCSGCSKYLIRV